MWIPSCSERGRKRQGPSAPPTTGRPEPWRSKGGGHRQYLEALPLGARALGSLTPREVHKVHLCAQVLVLGAVFLLLLLVVRLREILKGFRQQGQVPLAA